MRRGIRWTSVPSRPAGSDRAPNPLWAEHGLEGLGGPRRRALLTVLGVMLALAAPPACTPDTLQDNPDIGTVVEKDAGVDVPVDAGACAPGGQGCPQHASPCRVYVCNTSGQCKEAHEKDGTLCDDGDGCTQDTACLKGACVGGTKTDCDDGNPCTESACDAASGKCVSKPLKEGSSCEPEQTECWGYGNCKEGKCVGSSPSCTCHPEWEGDDDPVTPKCDEWVDEEDHCQGRMACFALAKGKYGCQPNEATVVTCSDKKDTDCRKNLCDKATAKCGMASVNEGKGCNDGDACTSGEVCDKGVCKIHDSKQVTCKCTPQFLDACINELGTDPCLGVVYCDTSGATPVCKQGAPVKCANSKDTSCLKNTCNEDNGKCQMVPVVPLSTEVSVLCDDGNPCTVNDFCDNGECASGLVSICTCDKDADCASFDDGNLCNGTMYCDKASGECKVNPATTVVCQDVNDTDCLKAHCLATVGVCKMVPVNQLKLYVLSIPSLNEKGEEITIKQQKLIAYPYVVKEFVACDDGNACTQNDSCVGSSCKPGDTIVCTCNVDADCAPQDDGNLCNGTLYCDKTGDKAVCKQNPSTVVTCPNVNDTVCLKNACLPTVGKCQLTPAKDEAPCDDGDSCTVNDACVKGVCEAGKVQICACKSNADCAAFDDPNLCSGTLYCDKQKGECKVNPTTVVKCSSSQDTQCLKNKCQPKTGKCVMTAVNEDNLCDDGDPCTPSPVCTNGKCFAETSVCQCKDNPDCALFEDGNLCTGTLFCNKTTGSCETNPATVVTCPPGNNTVCLKNSCQPSSGKCIMEPVIDDVILCEDGNPCTQSDKCHGGKCKSGTNTCQCKVDADCAFIDNGDLCDGTLFCDASDPKAAACKPKPNSQVICKADDGKTCLLEVCNPKTGKCEASDRGTCDDGDSCTLDTCVLSGADAGKCTHKAAPDGTPAGVKAGSSGQIQVCVAGKAVDVPQGMALVPGGKVAVGCAPQDKACTTISAENPQHLVTVSNLWLDKLEVTVGAYGKCVTAGSCKAPTMTDKGCNYGQAGADDQPMNCVSHADANAFCAAAGTGGRLPTEAEWEKAARGGCALYASESACKASAPVYVWGSAPTPSCAQSIMADPKLSSPGCGEDGTSAVASRYDSDVGPYGHFDLAGNAREWVGDTWDATFYTLPGAIKDDPLNSAAGSDIVVRGGGWKSPAVDLRISARGKLTKAAPGAVDVGFRCARPIK